MTTENFTNYQEEPDILERLLIQTDFFIKKILVIVLFLATITFLLIAVILGPAIFEYETSKYRGHDTIRPVVFEVNNESYPDLNKLDEFENNTIDLDSIPIEEE